MACKQFNQIYRNNNNNSSNLIKFPRSTPPCAHLKRCRCHAPTPAEQLATCLNFFSTTHPHSLSCSAYSLPLPFSSFFPPLLATWTRRLSRAWRCRPSCPTENWKLKPKATAATTHGPQRFFFGSVRRIGSELRGVGSLPLDEFRASCEVASRQRYDTHMACPRIAR